MNVSILILTYNEAANLPRVLEALNWCDDIVVLDSGSTDETINIAQTSGARLLHRPFDDFAGQRNWGLENGDFRHDWVLHLDADEIVPGAFVEALKTLQVEDGIDAYHVPSKMMLFGRWIRHAGMYPTYQVRLGHKDRLRFVQVGHGQREDLPPSRVGTFSEPYLHYSFAHGMERWLSKHIRYARDEAGLILEYRKLSSEKSSPEGATERRRNAKVKAAKIPVILRPLMRFFYVYLIKQGFRDGRGGLAYALMLSVYEGMTAIFVLQTLLGGSAIPEHGNQKGK